MSRSRLRRPLPFWALALTVSLVTTLLVSGLVGRVDAAADRWGEVRAVVIAVDDIPAGEEISAGDVRVEDRPVAMLPEDTLADAPVGERASAAIAAGEPLVASRVASTGSSRLAALLPDDTSGLAIPFDRVSIALEVGDVVDLLATFDPAAAAEAGGDPTFPVARRAVVIDVGEDGITVAVAEEDAPRVAFALANGIVTPALRG